MSCPISSGRHLDSTLTACQVFFMEGFAPGHLLLDADMDGLGEHDETIFVSFAATDRQLATFEIDVFHA